MTDFVLELLSEEIPARMQARARGDLGRMFAEEMEKAGLATGAIDVHSTPRRLVLIAREVAAETEASREEIKGPRASAPPQALEGFLRKTGLAREQLEERDGVLFAVIERPGRPAAAVIAEAVARIVADFPWPKSMRWGSGTLRWVRPLHGVVAILGDAIVPVEIDGVASGATTVGHRFHHPGPITIGGAGDYAEKLRACHVIVDQDERERIIREGAAAVAKDAGLTLLDDEGLVVENAGLTEWPVPLLGRFDPDFLDVPREVIVLTMRTNQKYFACAYPPPTEEGGQPKAGGVPGNEPPPSSLRDATSPPGGRLAPAFVCVANVDAKDGGEGIVEGNKRVLAARLADARFFWEQDVKVPLEEQAAKLGGIVFHEKLGTVADKVERVAKLARWLVEQQIVTPAKAGAQAGKGNLGSRLRGNDEEVARLADQAERAARLAKADLVTGMVGEFPELQGVMGGYLAEAQGEPKAVADAVRDHYKPVGQGDEVPTAPVTVAVALADKLDTLIGFFGADIRPTGSKDPYALRRAMLGVISIILENRLRLKLVGLFDQLQGHDLSMVNAGGHFGNFIAERLKVQQREAGVRHDIIDAVFALGSDDGATVGADGDLGVLLARVKALQAFVETGEGGDLLAAYKRAANILKKEKWPPETRHPELGSGSISSSPEQSQEWMLKQVQHDGLESEEAALVKALDKAEPKVTVAVEKENFTGAMAALAKLRGPIDAFFDHVTVNDPDGETRARRLNLLARFRDAVNGVADFEKIEG